jgi:hypothetical protein
MTNTDDKSLSLSNLASSFAELQVAAAELNTVSDELGKSITALDGVFKGLNLGITTWVTIQRYGDPDNPSWYQDQEIGYGKIGQRWGVAVRVVTGDHDYPETGSCEEWLFNDAPRTLRVAAIDKLPHLVEGLIATARSTAKDISGKISYAQQVVQTIKKTGQRK